jgi:hydroxypyruvate reductase
VARLAAQGVDAQRALADNDAYTALQAGGDLLITGPTGTNVNDVTLLLVK